MRMWRPSGPCGVWRSLRRWIGYAQHPGEFDSPGLIRTPLTEKIPDDLVTIPLGRPGDPREVSTFVLFLASDESSYATGAEFVIDGGLVADVPRKARG
jgi:Enoyl-(Acyl carrier protein) reductase